LIINADSNSLVVDFVAFFISPGISTIKKWVRLGCYRNEKVNGKTKSESEFLKVKVNW